MEKDSFSYSSLLLLDVQGNENGNKVVPFPYKSALSFRLLIEHIEEAASSENKARRALAKAVLKGLEDAPELLGPVYDPKKMIKYENVLKDMLMFIFPDFFWEKQTYAIGFPFEMEISFGSPKFNEIIKISEANTSGQMNLDAASFSFGKTIGGFAAILRKVYGVNLNFDFPIVYKIPDPVTGLDRYYKLNLADEFTEVVAKGDIRKFNEEEIKMIRQNLYDLEFMKKMLPPENFEFHGFIVINAINITDTEILSSMKRNLIEKDAIITYPGFLKLQHSMKSLMRCPGLLLGLFDCDCNQGDSFEINNNIGSSFLLDCKCEITEETLRNSIYEYSFEEKKVVIIEDLRDYPNKTMIEESILEKGIRNILIAPLIHGNEIVGMMELGSPQPGQINMLNTLKLREVLPLFAMAVSRSRSETNNKIQAIIKEKCTAIHPSLEWRFRRAARKLLKLEEQGKSGEMEEIIFHNVYPLYGLSDIRNSSLQRNIAIRDDLIENLNLAYDVIDAARISRHLHAFDELIFRIEKKIESLKFSIDSGDEAQTLNFIRKQVVPMFEHLQGYGDPVRIAVDKYNSMINEKLGFVYRKRKDYEESATMLNDMIAAYIDEEQVKIQKMYPHYFERYKTDGVDHNIYIGGSLVQNGNFNKLHLRNIRLWQLMLMCGIIRKAKHLKKNLSLPLETAHLILVQNSPLSIKFRFDEKKFDVDGAYNIRYEIMKKRIDKAEIKGKEERLTQPEKIAIVYSQSVEEQEYFEYFEYLQANGYLKKEIEELELEEVQGVKGLKSLRVSVITENKNVDDTIDNGNLKIAVENMSVN